jgi:signal transduction histidine kinase
MSDTPRGLTAREVLQLVKDNFVIISGAAVVTGVALAITFLTAYLLVFDWHLLWFVQYTDILTFGLLALGVVAGVLGIFINFLNIWMTWTSVSVQSRRLFLKIAGSLAVAALALEIWSAWHRGEEITHVILKVFAIDGIINIISGSGSYRRAEANFELILPYLKDASREQKVRCWRLLRACGRKLSSRLC